MSISVAIDVNESSATRINSMLNSMMRELMEYDAHLLHRDRDDETAYKLTVGELLVKGGFAEEGRKALCKAMALAAAAACHVKGRGAVDERIVPVEVADFMAVRDLLNLAPEQALLLQLAVQDQEFPDPVTSARRFNSVCLFTVEFNCPVPG